MRSMLGLAFLLTACGNGPTPITLDLAAAPDLAMPFMMPAPTYSNFAQFFFSTYCVRCHPSAASARDFTMYSVIQQNAHDIACGVSSTPVSGCSGTPAPGQFPIGSGPFPSDEERNELVAWIMAGLPM
jgi:hypothetical protein